MPDYGEKEREERRYSRVARGIQGDERRAEGDDARDRGNALGASIRVCIFTDYEGHRPSQRIAGHQEGRKRAENPAFVENLEIAAFRLIGNVADTRLRAVPVMIQNGRLCFDEIRPEAAGTDARQRVIGKHVPGIEPDLVADLQ